MKSSKFRKFFTGVEIILCIALLLGAGSGVANYNQKRRIKNLSADNVTQAVKIDGLVLKIDEVNKKKDQIIEKKEEIEDKLKAQASTGFSILYEQAADIKDEHPSPYTKTHLETAKEYIKVWGYDGIARIIKWQSDLIQTQLQETKKLMEKEQELRKEYLEYKVVAEKQLITAKYETEEHIKTASSLKQKVDEFMGANDWLQTLIRYGIIGGIIYVFVSFGGFGLLFRSASKHKQVKNKLVKAVKIFSEVDDVGNETMCRVMKGHGIDLDKEDDDV